MQTVNDDNGYFLSADRHLFIKKQMINTRKNIEKEEQ